MAVVERTLQVWKNYHATISCKDVPETRPVLGPGDPMTGYGAALKSFVAKAFADDCPIRPAGATWSLSEIGSPGDANARMLETSDLNQIATLGENVTSGTYRARTLAKVGTPVLVDAGTHIGPLNDALGDLGLAIRTSGAGDGHRIAGLIATGTHGSALRVGCLHDTVVAIHLMISPTEAILVQPEKFDQKHAGPDAPFVAQLADLVGGRIGIPTTMLTDDELFDAALVGLGSCGIVLSVVIDAAPLYLFDGEIRAFDAANAMVLDTIHTLDATKLGLGADPYHLAFVAVPYARAGQDGFYVTALHQRDAAGKPFDRALDRTSMASNCLSNFLGDLIPLIAAGPLNQVVSSVIQTLAAKNYGPRDIVGLFPGQTFGPTGLPRGHGHSTELVVDHRHARAAVEVVLRSLRDEGLAGRFLLGAVGIRFVPATRALLGMSHHPMNCFIELPTLASSYMATLFANVTKALDDAHVPYCYHWGQEHQLTPKRVADYYGARAERWCKARETLLPDAKARRLFASPILKPAGLR